MGFRKANQVILGLMVFSTAVLLIPSAAHAFGPSKPSAPAYTLPNPMRYVIVRPFTGVAAIETPNQVTTTMANVQQSLDEDLQAVVSNAKTHLSYSNGNDLNEQDPCGKHLEIWPAVNAFEMNDMTANIQFGFNNGVTNVISGEPVATASDTISLGNITLSFMLMECDNSNTGNCSSLLSTQSNQLVVGNNFTFNVTWSMLGANGNILNNADLNNAMLAIMTNGISQMTGSSTMAQVPWEAKVTSVGSFGIQFDAGQQQGIAMNQYFTVYAPLSSSDLCGVRSALSCIYTSEVDGPLSIGTVYKTLDAGQGVQVEVGDIVEVGATSCAP